MQRVNVSLRAGYDPIRVTKEDLNQVISKVDWIMTRRIQIRPEFMPLAAGYWNGMINNSLEWS